MILHPDTIAKILVVPSSKVYMNAPLIESALVEAGIDSPHVQIAALATVKVETGIAFAPIREKRADINRQPKLWALQERYWNSGFYGRGYIQLTWEENYKKYGQELGIDLVGQPDLALDPTNAARILAAYFRKMHVDKAANAQDWQKVRHLVNGGEWGMSLFLSMTDGLLKALAGGE